MFNDFYNNCTFEIIFITSLSFFLSMNEIYTINLKIDSVKHSYC